MNISADKYFGTKTANMNTSAVGNIPGSLPFRWPDITTEVAINTVVIAHLGTNRETIQVNIQSVCVCIKAHGSQKCMVLKSA